MKTDCSLTSPTPGRAGATPTNGRSRECQPAGGKGNLPAITAMRLQEHNKSKALIVSGGNAPGYRLEQTRKRKSFGCHAFHPISTRRCIVVLVDALNFPQNAMSSGGRRPGMQHFSANAGSIHRGKQERAGGDQNALFPACKARISDLSSSTCERSTTMELVSHWEESASSGLTATI